MEATQYTTSRCGMLGAIAKWDVLTSPAVTIRCFGWRVFLRTLFAGRNQTFLSVLVQEGTFEPASGTLFEVVRRCARLEQAAGRIYRSLAQRFNDQVLVQEFFTSLAQQEAEHEELLETCRIAAVRGGWDGSGLDPLRETVPGIERRMRGAEAKLRAVRTLRDALWLTIEMESSEINRLFSAIVAATDSEFVRRFKVFRHAVRGHLSYIQGIVTTLMPSFRPACEEMLAAAARPSDGVDSRMRAESV